MKNVLLSFTIVSILMRLYLCLKGDFRDMDSALERALLAVYCVQVSKSQLLVGPRKFPLNIETIKFC